jgi:branched-subunit amino acid ABC-type transport system permease component
MPSALADQIVGGLAIGFVYGLIALGFTILLKSLDLFFFAQGEMITLGAFIGLALATRAGLPYWILLILVTVLMGLVGMLIERVLFRPMVRRRMPLTNMVLASVGLSLLIRNAVQLFAGGDNLAFPPIFPTGRLAILGVNVNALNLAILAVGVVYTAALWYFFYRTRTGIALRASSEDLETARLMGISPDSTYRISFALSASLGGACGILLGPIFFVGYDLGTVSFNGLVGSSIGGLYSLNGALAGGLGVGLVSTLTAGSLSSAWKDFVAYAVLVAVLLIASVRAARASGRGYR